MNNSLLLGAPFIKPPPPAEVSDLNTMKNKIILIVIAAVILIPLFSIFYFLGSISNPCGKGDKRIIIDSGLGVNEISNKLYNEGMVCDKFAFETYLWLKKSENKIKAGEYYFNKPLSIINLAGILFEGQKNGKEITIKFIEGWDSREIGGYLENENIVLKKEFLNTISDAGDFKKSFSFLNSVPNGKSLEGFLFPDTYRIYNDSEALDIAVKALKNFDKKLTAEMRGEILRQDKDIYEIVTMASVIEKEVRSVEDMKIVSGIFWDRIKYGQPLESCATIGYILGEDKTRYSYEDTRINSPYNTYINKGLPLGPISNPGLRAIEAAIYPEFTDYNYFLSKPDGETVFSITYEEHLENSNRYLR